MTILTITDTTRSGMGDVANKATWDLAHDPAASTSVNTVNIQPQWRKS